MYNAAYSVGVIFGTEHSINHILNAAILDCNWTIHEEGWDKGVRVEHWKFSSPSPSNISFTSCPLLQQIYPLFNPSQLPNPRWQPHNKL